MSVRDGWAAQAAAFVATFATILVGCSPNPTAVGWVARGVQVAKLDLPLSGDEHSFMVREYILEGQEASEMGLRHFRDRLLGNPEVVICSRAHLPA
jgi:hypothetical protein